MSTRDLLTVSDRVELLVNGLNSGVDHKPVVKIFSPDAAATWLFTESDPDDPDRLFGLCDLGLGYPEMGYVSLAELSALKGPLGLPLERDLHFIGDKPLSAYADEARTNGRIIA